MASETKATSATAKVFNTFELLESILIHVLTGADYDNFYFRNLRLMALYRFQRVNSTFRVVIGRSKALHVGMFRERQFDKDNEDAQYDDRGKYQREKDFEHKINPLINFFEKLLSLSLPCPSVMFIHEPQKITETRIRFLMDNLGEARVDSTGWRNMLLASRPLHSNVSVHLVWEPRPSQLHHIKLSDGATLGEVADKVMRVVKVAQLLDQDEVGGIAKCEDCSRRGNKCTVFSAS